MAQPEPGQFIDRCLADASPSVIAKQFFIVGFVEGAGCAEIQDIYDKYKDDIKGASGFVEKVIDRRFRKAVRELEMRFRERKRDAEKADEP